ncbi:MAG: hypothetical protein FJ098_03050 [Deltaproteobacteria bacterium]|nr:hypothetical protein [Deltaproteobacteria bacterium]
MTGTLRLLGLGDSLTFGYMVPTGYLRMVEEDLRAEHPGADLHVFNHGVCGDTVLDGLARAPALLTTLSPTTVLVQFGLNDCFCGISPGRFLRGLEELVEECRRLVSGIRVLLVPPPPLRDPSMELAVPPFREAFDVVGLRHGIAVAPVVARWNAGPRNGGLWLSDGVHPSVAGYRLMADAVLAEL